MGRKSNHSFDVILTMGRLIQTAAEFFSKRRIGYFTPLSYQSERLDTGFRETELRCLMTTNFWASYRFGQQGVCLAVIHRILGP